MSNAPQRCAIEVGLQKLRGEQLIAIVGDPAAELGTGIEGDEAALTRCECYLQAPMTACRARVNDPCFFI
jgi:hypothetical protein